MWLHVSTVNGHHQDNKEYSVEGTEKYTNVLYLKQNVLYWPDDDRLRSKHVATM